MENVIARKATCLTLIAIMVAGGLTFAVPAAAPVAHAQTNALYVSAESSVFENYFVGAQVIEVIVNDQQYRTDENRGASFEPIVTVDDNTLPMNQSQSGNWYGYFVDMTKALAAQSNEALYYGTCADRVDELQDCENVDIGVFNYDPKRNVLAEPGVSNPPIYAYTFTEGSDIDVELENADRTETVTLTYDTVEDYAQLTLDRAMYPQKGYVHISIQDVWLNIDPTSEDVWTFETMDGMTAAYYRDDVVDPNTQRATLERADTPAIDLSGLMCDDNCVLILDPDKQGKGQVVTLQNNTDRKFTKMDMASFAIRFEETGSNTGVFTNADDDDAANVVITGNAQRGTTATIDYNDSPIDIPVGNAFASIDIMPNDENWDSGEEIPVIITDNDANRNSQDDEDMLVSNPDMIIPTLVTGSPFTLNDDSTYDSGKNMNTEAFSMRGMVDVDKTDTLVIRYNDQPLNALKDVIAKPGFKGFAYFNYHFGSLATADDSDATIDVITLTVADPQLDRAIDTNMCMSMDTHEKIYACLSNAGVSTSVLDDVLDLANPDADDLDKLQVGNFVDVLPCSVELVGSDRQSGPSGRSQHYVNIPGGNISGLDKCDDNADVALVVTFEDRVSGSMSPIVADFMSFGYSGDGVQGSERIANQIIRIEAEENDDNSGVFEGSLEYIMVNQLNILDQKTYDSVDPITDSPTFIVIEDLTDEDAPKVTYLDLGADGVATQVSDQEEAPSHSGIVSFDSSRYKVADTVVVTLEDADLNVDSELIDIYTVVDSDSDAVFGKVGDATDATMYDGKVVVETFGNLGRLLDITFDDTDWPIRNINSDSMTDYDRCADQLDRSGSDWGLHKTGFTLVETGVATGIFTGDFQIPRTWCAGDDATPVTTTGLDIEVNYLDFRDASGEIIEVGDSAAVSSNTGSVSLDRTVYPVPFGLPTEFTAAEDKPSYFPVHSTSVDSKRPAKTGTYLTGGDLTIHIRVTDPDFDVSASGQDTIAEAMVGGIDPTSGEPTKTKHTGLVKVSVIRGSDVVTLGYAGGPSTKDYNIYNGIPSGSFPDNSPEDYSNDIWISDTVRQFGPIQEISPDAGVFEIDIDLRYTDGPASNDCPITSRYTSLDDGSAKENAPADYRDSSASAQRFDRVGNNEHFCIMQGDILQVEYTDPIDASGDENTVTDSATFDLRNGVLQSDKSSYVIGTDMILTLIEPDFDLDNDQAETYDLDLIEWDSDAATVTMGDLGGNGAAFDPEPTAFRETGDSTGIFQTIVEIPEELDGDRLERNEAITMEYTDWGPAGADYVGDEDEDVTLDIMTSDFGATIELDQKVYTWTDKVYVTVVAPDHNFDGDLVDEIGNTDTYPLKISTRGNELEQYKLVETGTDTGIFTGEVILSGFQPHDADGDGVGDDARGITGDDTGTGRSSGLGPTNGYLQTTNDDGLSVSFEYSEDITIVTSAIVRWNIGEVQWLESSYPASGTGVVRIIDPDMNLNPEAVDNFDVNVWSDSDAGGIDLTVTETNEATGIFEGTVTFTMETESSGHRLRAAEGDTVTVEYNDNTLPDPYNTRDDLDITATTLIGTVVPPLERAPASNLRVVDSFGNSLDTVSMDQQVSITADLRNGQDRDQAFAYIVQVQDENGIVVSLTWITGSLTAGQSFSPAGSWTPSDAGTYTATAFVWESLDNPTALSPPISVDITVQ